MAEEPSIERVPRPPTPMRPIRLDGAEEENNAERTTERETDDSAE